MGLRVFQWGWMLSARFALVAVVVANMLAADPAAAFTPESPQVKKMVKKGLRYLAKASEGRLGGVCLMGMAFKKDGQDENHPVISKAIQQCRQTASRGAVAVNEDIYSTGIAIIFLCDMDEQTGTYGSEIQTLLESLELRQKPEGGWGYPTGGNAPTGDTSMTQYGVLSTWYAYRNGNDASLNSAEEVCNWLIRTQDPSGGFGYQGEDPGLGDYRRVNQASVGHALSAAGSGSVYILADLLGFTRAHVVPESTGLPDALKLVQAEKAGEAGGPLTKEVSRKLIRRAMKDADRWMARNYKIDPESWTHYYLYALERYQSFREMATGKVSPRWYDDGVRYLGRTQKRNGSWKSGGGDAVDTSFALLFLQRSTKKTIEKVDPLKSFGDSTLVGGRDLKGDPTKMHMQRGRIVRETQKGAADDILSILDDPDHPDLDYLVEYPSEMMLSEDPAERAKQVARLRRMAESGEHYKSRVVAVRTLARMRDLDHVPVLIHALTDPDSPVVHEARDGLRFVSRRFTGFGLKDRPGKSDVQSAVSKWKQWYLSVRPGAEFYD